MDKKFRPKEFSTQHIEIAVKGDVMKAWRKMKKKLMNARVLEEVKERRYYVKPLTTTYAEAKELLKIKEKKWNVTDSYKNFTFSHLTL